MPATTPASLTAITMERAKEQFTHWRATRSKRCKIPEYLWEVVRHLAKEQGYGLKEINSSLGLTYRQLRVNTGLEVTSDEPLTATSFMKVDFPLPPSISALPSFLEQQIVPLPLATLEITRPDGAHLKTSGLPSKDLSSVIQHFIS